MTGAAFSAAAIGARWYVPTPKPILGRSPSPTFALPMPPSLADLKKALIAAGFELYRTRGDELQVADRVRDNLIMDSGVSLRVGDALSVKIVFRAQLSDFAGDDAERLFDRARELGVDVVHRGYSEAGTLTSHVRDPAEPTRTLDTWYEVWYEKPVASVEEAMREVGLATKLEKAARGSS